MNIVLLLVHLLLTSYAPTNQTTTSDGDTGTTVNPGTGKDKGGKYGNGDYIITNDTHP